MSMENPLTLAGIELAAFRVVAQHLNHCAIAVHDRICYFIKFEINKQYKTRFALLTIQEMFTLRPVLYGYARPLRVT